MFSTAQVQLRKKMVFQNQRKAVTVTQHMQNQTTHISHNIATLVFASEQTKLGTAKETMP